MRNRLETSCMDSSWKNNRHVFIFFDYAISQKVLKIETLKLVSAKRGEVFGEILEKRFFHNFFSYCPFLIF